nr:hypothetical protein [Tanacetum cinerariifolium]
MLLLQAPKPVALRKDLIPNHPRPSKATCEESAYDATRVDTIKDDGETGFTHVERVGSLGVEVSSTLCCSGGETGVGSDEVGLWSDDGGAVLASSG